jgi:hypothetical protein
MTEKFVGVGHGRDHPEISITDGGIEVFRNGASLGDLLVYIPAMMLGIALEGAGLFVVGNAVYSAVREFRPLFVLLILVFGVPTAGVAWIIVTLQGLIFPFRLIVSRHSYVLRNGLVRVSRDMDSKDCEIVVRPTFRKRFWGYSANMRLRAGGFRWPFFPGGVWGTKHAAAAQALTLSEWLEPRVPEIKLTMAKGWGNIWADKKE